MTPLEKRFVNAGGHSGQVADVAERRVRRLPFRPGQTYLDVGCGNGAATRQVAGACHLKATGVDADADQVRLAEEAGSEEEDVRFLVSDACGLPFADGEFDIVSTNKVTHHIVAWKLAVTEMIRVLRPGGYFLYGDIVLPRWVAACVRPLAGRVAGVVTEEELGSVLREAGVDVVHRVSSGFGLELIGMRSSLVSERPPATKAAQSE